MEAEEKLTAMRVCFLFPLLAGYSWKTNQHGLTVDTIAGFELVLPDGTIAHVSQDSHPDLFWGLKVRGWLWLRRKPHCARVVLRSVFDVAPRFCACRLGCIFRSAVLSPLPVLVAVRG